jgi:hypothetical protein
VKNQFKVSHLLVAFVITMVVLSTSCGGKVQGNTYADNGGVVKVEFKSGGKAYVSTGPVTTTCTYSESGKSVALICEGDKSNFTIDDDGALNGPPGGFLARLTKVK